MQINAMSWSNKWDDVSVKDAEKHWSYPPSIELSIETTGDPIKVTAAQIGDLAVHEPIADENGMWRQITHVPTMSMFDKALPDRPEGMNLLWWITEVQKGCLDEWAVLRQLTPENYKLNSDRVLRAKDKILQYCQSVVTQ